MACENGGYCVSRGGRVVGLLDVDAFLVQVYAKAIAKGPEWRVHFENFPLFVADHFTHNPIVSVNKAGRSFGIRQGMGAWSVGDVPVMKPPLWRQRRHGMPEVLTPYRAMNDIINVLLDFRNQMSLTYIVERGEGSEVYLDLTEDSSNMAKWTTSPPEEHMDVFLEMKELSLRGGEVHTFYNDILEPQTSPSCGCLQRHIQAAILINQLKTALLERTQFSASCGVGSNKLIAWFARNSHKPIGTTILTLEGLTCRVGKWFPILLVPQLPLSILDSLKNHFPNETLTFHRLGGLDDALLLRLLTPKDCRTVKQVVRDVAADLVKPMPFVSFIRLTVDVSPPVSCENDNVKVKSVMEDLVRELFLFLEEEHRVYCRVAMELHVHFVPPEGGRPRGAIDVPEEHRVSLPFPSRQFYGGRLEQPDAYVERVAREILRSARSNWELVATDFCTFSVTAAKFFVFNPEIFPPFNQPQLLPMNQFYPPPLAPFPQPCVLHFQPAPFALPLPPIRY